MFIPMYSFLDADFIFMCILHDMQDFVDSLACLNSFISSKITSLFFNDFK